MTIMTGEPDQEKYIDALLTLAVLAAIAVVAYTDWVVISVSLGYLYLLPLSLSAVVHRLRTSLLLVAVCVVLHDWFGPFEHAGWQHIVRNLLSAVGFATVVILVNRLAGQRSRLSDIVRRQRDELAQEITLGAEVQQRLLPRKPPELPGFDVAGAMHPAKLVGGDYYDYVQLPEGSVGLAIADVSGKGVAAALLMPTVEVALRMAAWGALRTDEVLKTLNRVVYEVTDESRYVTLFYAILHPGQRLLEYTSAGHYPALLIRAASQEPAWLETGGLVLGLIPDAVYKTGRVELCPDDVLVLYTDGVIEARNQNEEEFSRERLVSLVQSHAGRTAQELVEAIHAAVMEFKGTSVLDDDLTLIVLKVRGNNAG
jgi:serine phosphatase RsbU (regulator of sigma subunit)